MIKLPFADLFRRTPKARAEKVSAALRREPPTLQLSSRRSNP
jgi:hypothetical protein